MQDVMQLRQSTIEKIETLSREKLVEVLNFIDLLLARPAQPTSSALPAPDAFLECAGTWAFEPGELEEILQDIEQSRLMELEDEYRWLT